MMKDLMFVLSSVFLFLGVSISGGAMIVADGEARGEIVIAGDAGRTVRLAAQELRDSVEKISGARLPIVFAPTGGVEAQLYVGASEWTDKLGVDADGLEAGAYRIVSGDGWMVFIGDDTLFEPREPWARNNGQVVSGVVQQQWEEATGGHNGGCPTPGCTRTSGGGFRRTWVCRMVLRWTRGRR